MHPQANFTYPPRLKTFKLVNCYTPTTRFCVSRKEKQFQNICTTRKTMPSSMSPSRKIPAGGGGGGGLFFPFLFSFPSPSTRCWCIGPAFALSPLHVEHLLWVCRIVRVTSFTPCRRAAPRINHLSFYQVHKMAPFNCYQCISEKEEPTWIALQTMVLNFGISKYHIYSEKVYIYATWVDTLCGTKSFG